MTDVSHETADAPLESFLEEVDMTMSIIENARHMMLHGEVPDLTFLGERVSEHCRAANLLAKSPDARDQVMDLMTTLGMDLDRLERDLRGRKEALH